MSNVFNQLTSSDILETINNSIERRFKALDELLNKELILSSKLDENIQMLNSMSKDISSTLNSFEKQKNLYTLSAELLNANIIKLNSHMDNLSSENLKSIYTNIVKSIETMKNDMEKIEWKFKKEIDEYDEKITHKLQNSLELIDVETSKIVKDLSEFKELSK
jgi:predicted ribosome quality control (RQC) complex YloA/Tae2 family protein